MKTLFGISLALFLLTSSCYGDLIHYYSFTLDASDSVGGANGTLLNGASVSGGTLNLDGLDDFVQFGSKIVPTSGSYSVAMFAQQTASLRPLRAPTPVLGANSRELCLNSSAANWTRSVSTTGP